MRQLLRSPLIVTLFVILGCGRSASESSSTPEATATVPSTQQPERLMTKHLPNAVRLHEKVISGGLPEGDPAFAELVALGIKTVISVDGAKPDVDRAKKFGLRYIHLPHGYDGISSQRQLELAKAVRDLTGPIYIHCHHGKHRSPAAASVACIGAGLIPQKSGLAVLELAGTSPNYQGLYAAAENVTLVAPTKLDGLQVEFQEVAPVTPMAEAMVELEHVHDRVKMIGAAQWQSPPAHPDLDPAHEVLLLREQFTELLRTPEVQRETVEYQQLLQDCESLCNAMETMLRASLSADERSSQATKLNEQLESLNSSCKTCHQKFRDIPRDKS